MEVQREEEPGRLTFSLISRRHREPCIPKRSSNKVNSFPFLQKSGGSGNAVVKFPYQLPPLRFPVANPPPTLRATLYYLESYFAGCLLANRIVTRVPFARPRAATSNSRYRYRWSKVFHVRTSLPPSCSSAAGKIKGKKIREEGEI